MPKVLIGLDKSSSSFSKEVLKSSLNGKISFVLVESSPENFSKLTLGDFVSTRIFLTDNRKEAVKFVFSNSIVETNGKTVENIVKEILWISSSFGREGNRKKYMDNIFFTSDTHFGHGNIIKYCNRPWNSGKDESGEILVTDENVREMDEEMIRRWNEKVPSKDAIVWHLGDFCLGKMQKERIPEIVSRLNGRINLVLGNHDHQKLEFYYKAGFNRVYDHPVVLNKFIVLSHEPMEFMTPNAPWFSVYGHVHGSENYETFSKCSCCVCVERHGYAPISMNEMVDRCGLKEEMNNG